MGRARAFLAALMVTATFLLAAITTPVAAASTRWTSDVDFQQTGALFNGIEVVDVGAAARLELMKDSLDWKNANPPSPPGAREGPGLAFSSEGNVSVLFGGFFVNDFADTWEYDAAANSWTETTPGASPPGREWPGLSYDPVEKVVVLFGGLNFTDGMLNDTWEYDVSADTWEETSPVVSPPPLAHSPLAYHATAARHVVVGQDYFGSGAMKTWAYDASADAWTDLAPSVPPSPRGGYDIEYHAARDRILLFGGADVMLFLGDTWEYAYGGSWSQVGGSGPPPRAGYAMAYWSGARAVLLFGGLTLMGVSQETWRYSETQVWEPVDTANKPAPRRDHGFTYDVKNRAAVLYGGRTGSGLPLADTFLLGAAYRAAGKYTSGVFDSGGANVVWQRIWWNKTTANQPANTMLRFQVAAADVPNPPIWDFVGIGGSPFTYYTTPGDPIWTGHTGHRYLRFLGDFGSTNSQVTPSLEDLTITYNVPPLPPYVVSTGPSHGTVDVSIDQTIHIVFSEAMDPGSISVTFLQGPAVSFTPSWTNADSEVDLAHIQPFEENQVYELLVAAKDAGGSDLVSGPVPNPWTFVTEKIYPQLLNADPTPNEVGVPDTQPVFVNFTESMNTSTVSWNITPYIDLTPAWSNGSASLKLDHSSAFLSGTYYTIEVDGKDLTGLSLMPGLTANPWTFAVGTHSPYIGSTSPADLATLVPPFADVVVVFSEAMDTSSVTFAITPSVPGQSFAWSSGDTVLTMTHAQPFSNCTVYEVTVSGNDSDEGLPLIGNPLQPIVANPWRFAPPCDHPFIVAVRPRPEATDVSTDQPLLIAFSGGMDPPTVVVQVTGGPYRETNRTWSPDPGYLFVTIEHLPFTQCHRYTVTVTGRSGGGMSLVPGFEPNPWSFDIVCEVPFVTGTDPANDTSRVAPDSPIVVHFSEPMDTANFLALSIPTVALDASWSDGNRTVTLSHVEEFAPCSRYDVFVDGLDVDGNSLLTGDTAPVAPDPWIFTTRCPDFFILRTDPAANETSVPFDRSLVVGFSHPADPSTFLATLVPPVPLVPTWTNENMTVTLTHGEPFPECAMHTVTVSANDTFGSPLTNVTGAQPNPWSFETECTPPQILLTSPPDGATNVGLGAPIVVTFTEAMDPGTVTWSLTPPTIPFAEEWTEGNTVLTLRHTILFPAMTTFTISVAGRDLHNLSLEAGPVPNPWSFSTGSEPPAPSGLHVSRAPPDVVLSWDPVAGATSYVVLHSENRFAAWPWPELATTPSNGYVHAGADGDGLTHYYIVRAVDTSGVESGNSTMGVKASLSFAFDETRTNVYWTSLPYRSSYGKASDISDELASSKIDVVGKWDPETQTSIHWFFFRGVWRGTDFALNPGEGFFLGIRATFEWVVNGTDGDVNLSFTFYPPPNANVNWISLPYTSSYETASDVVLAIEGSLGGEANTKVVEVGRWDPLLQRFVSFSWTLGGWGGTDFSLVPGEAIFIRVVSSFGWAPRLLTPEVP